MVSRLDSDRSRVATFSYSGKSLLALVELVLAFVGSGRKSSIMQLPR